MINVTYWWGDPVGSFEKMKYRLRFYCLAILLSFYDRFAMIRSRLRLAHRRHVCVYRHSRWYNPYCFGAVVALDGEPVRNCVEASETDGFVICHRLDGGGNPYVDLETGDVAVERRCGKVEIMLAGKTSRGAGA